MDMPIDRLRVEIEFNTRDGIDKTIYEIRRNSDGRLLATCYTRDGADDIIRSIRLITSGLEGDRILKVTSTHK